jgi:hypothetical protein
MIQRIPDAAKLSKWPEDRPFEFIEIVVEEIAALDEVRCFGLYGKLDFACYFIVKPNVHQDIVSATP